MFGARAYAACIQIGSIGLLAGLGFIEPAQSQDLTGVGDLPGGTNYSNARGVSGNGLVVVGESNKGPDDEAFVWTASGGIVGIGDLPGGSDFSLASGVNADGSVVVGHSRSTNGTEAFRWTAGGGMVGLGDLPGGGFDSRATAVSADGSVVVGLRS